MSHLRLAPSTGKLDVSDRPITVVLADDHPLMRSSLRSLLEAEEGFEVVGEAADLGTAVRQVHRKCPDVLVLDLRMPGGSSIEAIRKLTAPAHETFVVGITMDDNPGIARHAFAAGAVGLVLKEFAGEELIGAVRAAAHGESPLGVRAGRQVD